MSLEPAYSAEDVARAHHEGSNFLEVVGLEGPETRTLHFVIDGDINNHELPVVFWFHGMFDIHASFVHKRFGVCGRSVGAPCPPTEWVSVVLDRPGYGKSAGPPREEYSYELFAMHVAAVADALGVERFYVSGHSSGGPCALACAAHLGDRVIGAGVMAGDCEYAEDGAPQLSRMIQGSAFFFGRYLMLGQHRGFEADFHAERAPWSFRCEAIARPVLIWHGAEDRIITEEISTFTAERIPGCVLETVEGAGHVSFLKMETQHEHVKRLMALCAERAGRTREA